MIDVERKTKVHHVMPNETVRRHAETPKCWCHPHVADDGRFVIHKGPGNESFFDSPSLLRDAYGLGLMTTNRP